MARHARQAVGPLYLLLCLLLGGSAQGIWANMALQLLGIAILAWAAMASSDEPLIPPAQQLLLLAAVSVGWIALQMVPLPASVWPHAGGRSVLADGYRILGIGVPPHPLSLTPQRSLDTLLGLIPPLALFCAAVRLRAYRPSWLVAALVAGTVAGILLGVLQVTSADYARSPWYLYEETTFGVATGFFANGNHMASLLVAALPFLAAVVASARTANRQRNSAIMLMAGGVTVVVLVGIVLNRSLAAYGLALPVLAGCALILLPPRSRWRWAVALLGGFFAIAAVAVLANSSTRPGSEAATSVQSRAEMLATTLHAIGDFMPWGSGLGSFRSVYQLYENPAEVGNVYVIHAHNDYAEIALELGVPGVLLLVAFLLWWGRAVWRAWNYSDAGPYPRAASVASAAILLHSLVDFPLRTAAIAAVFAMCLALLVERSVPVARARDDLRPTRHMVFR